MWCMRGQGKWGPGDAGGPRIRFLCDGKLAQVGCEQGPDLICPVHRSREERPPVPAHSQLWPERDTDGCGLLWERGRFYDDGAS